MRRIWVVPDTLMHIDGGLVLLLACSVALSAPPLLQLPSSCAHTQLHTSPGGGDEASTGRGRLTCQYHAPGRAGW